MAQIEMTYSHRAHVRQTEYCVFYLWLDHDLETISEMISPKSYPCSANRVYSIFHYYVHRGGGGADMVHNL